jgi:hypothetical protein
MQQIVAALVDTMTDEVIGNLLLFKHDAVAVRFFGDVCNAEGSRVAMHLNDHELRQLAILNDDLTLTPQARVIITGAQWLAAQPKAQEG